jgi:hypothetical protein
MIGLLLRLERGVEPPPVFVALVPEARHLGLDVLDLVIAARSSSPSASSSRRHRWPSVPAQACDRVRSSFISAPTSESGSGWVRRSARPVQKWWRWGEKEGGLGRV